MRSHPLFGRLAITVALSTWAASAPGAVPKEPFKGDKYEYNTRSGLISLRVSNLGYLGNGIVAPVASCEYPRGSNTEHLFMGGLWVGALGGQDGGVHVTTGAQDAATLQDGEDAREFDNFVDTDETWAGENAPRDWSNNQNDSHYHLGALATQHIELFSTDSRGGTAASSHIPLGLKVRTRVLDWGASYADDFVILDYTIINTGGMEMRDIYLGLWTDTVAGNTHGGNIRDPEHTPKWSYYDDYNSAWGPVGMVDPAYTVASDPGIWMSCEHDDDGDDGYATSWIGCRLLGTSEPPQPADGKLPVSFNLWRHANVPRQDDAYENTDNPGEIMPGRYQVMSNGEFDVGEQQGGNYAAASNWVSLLSTGPFPAMAMGDTLRITFAIVAAPDSVNLLANSKVAQIAYNNGFRIPTGPPSPRLEFGTNRDQMILSWEPGVADTNGVPLPLASQLRMPEHHFSDITGREDFQGYRIYRYQGASVGGDPYTTASLVAQFDKVDGIGFDTGLPPLGPDGRRRFVDTGLLDGSPYWYSVTSYSAPDIVSGLPEFESGFHENSNLIYPGPAAADWPADGIGVYPNPYRAASMFDAHDPSGLSEVGRKIWFTGLPAHSRIQVFTLSGDLVKTIEHDNANSGQEPWDLISEPVRSIASDLYIYAVTDLDTGQVRRGKLVIIK